MKQTSKPKRQASVTAEPNQIHPELLGLPLATPLRRGLALSLDLFLWFNIAMAVMLLLTAALLYFQYPKIYEFGMQRLAPRAENQGEMGSKFEFTKELLLLFADRNPQEISPEIKGAMDDENDQELESLVSDYSILFHLDFSGDRRSEIDYATKQIVVRPDLFFGVMNLAINLGILFLLYFTAFTWFFNGKTPGKWLFRIRVVRLDGQPIRLWDAFGRAGGYSASFSTLGIGFLEAFWHPNRQTVHDRISNTVVVRG